MNEFADTKNTTQTYRQMTQRASMSWPEREEQIQLQKLKLIQQMVSDIETIKKAMLVLIARVEDRAADKPQPKPASPPSKS